jgi:glucose-6-phosphate 1-epimerase
MLYSLDHNLGIINVSLSVVQSGAMNNNSSQTINLHHETGSRVSIDLDGARITSWIPAGESERLYVRAANALDFTEGLIGGIPLIFPQFADRGEGKFHGFVKDCLWSVTHQHSGGDSSAEFVLELDPKDHPEWAYHAVLRYGVTLAHDTLTVQLSVTNTGRQQMPFQAGLHTFLQATEGGMINGFEDRTYDDHVLSPVEVRGPDFEPIGMYRSMDRVFRDVSCATLLYDDGNLQMEQEGFDHVVVWRPADKISPTNEMRKCEFICVEPALLSTTLLLPGESWQGIQRLIFSPNPR